MEDFIIKNEGEDSLKVVRIFSQSVQSLIVDYEDMTARLEQSELRIKELEQENERLQSEQLRHDLWSSRVTYENVVELIASYEDASQRDEARKLIEPLLKKEQVRQLRRDIRLKVKELEEAEEAAQVPEELQTEEAEEIWSSLREAGFIAEGSYGLAKGVSANLATYIADRMAESLNIAHKWKVFQGLWNIKNMAQLAGSWRETGKLPPRTDEIDELI